MSSTFLGLEIGKRSLNLHQKGLNVIGHNLANADNENYSKQRIIPVALPALTEPSLNREERAGQIGQGSEVQAVRRDRDIYLDVRINQELSNKAYWAENHSLLSQVEDVHHALGDINIQERLDEFWKGWQELSINSAEPAVRQSLMQNAIALTRGINHQYRNLDHMRSEVNEKVLNAVTTINDLARTLAEVNTKILQSKNVGDNPNDLMDRRDSYIEQLSELVTVKTSYKDNDEIMVFLGSRMLVQGPKANFLLAAPNPDKEGLADIAWETTGDRLEVTTGKLSALLENRDVNIASQIGHLDELANTLVNSVNELHVQGFNQYNNRSPEFFREAFITNNPQGHFDTNGDGIDNATYLQMVTGQQRIDPGQLIGEDGVIRLRLDNAFYDIPYQRDMTVADLADRINLNNPNIRAYVNHEGSFVLKATNNGADPDFVIQYLEDSGNFLTGITGILTASGPAGAFEANALGSVNQFADGALQVKRAPARHPASWIGVNPDIIKDANLIASSDGTDYDGQGGKETTNGLGDGSIALEIAQLRNARLQLGE